jgi:hypothetical protein
MNTLIRLVAAALLLFACGPAFAQSAITHLNKSVSITTGNTYQQIEGTNTARRVLEVENNNASDNCYLEVTGAVAVGNTTSTNVTVNGATITSAKASILLLPGGSYNRYYPYVPSGPIVVTCASGGDSVYADVE